MDASLFRKVAKLIPHSWMICMINTWRPFRGAGIKITRATKDFKEIQVEMRLKWFNKNYVGTHFGGSLYSMTDPFYMIMLINNLGSNYIVWDKAARIEFKKPGKGRVSVSFKFSDEEIAEIKKQADSLPKYIFDKEAVVVNDSGEVIAQVTKTLYVKKK